MRIVLTFLKGRAVIDLRSETHLDNGTEDGTCTILDDGAPEEMTACETVFGCSIEIKKNNKHRVPDLRRHFASLIS